MSVVNSRYARCLGTSPYYTRAYMELKSFPFGKCLVLSICVVMFVEILEWMFALCQPKWIDVGFKMM